MFFLETLGNDRAAANRTAKWALIIWALSLVISGALFGSKGFAGVMLVFTALFMLDLLISILILLWRIKDK